jgi:hypothetical protein
MNDFENDIKIAYYAGDLFLMRDLVGLEVRKIIYNLIEEFPVRRMSKESFRIYADRYMKNKGIM